MPKKVIGIIYYIYSSSIFRALSLCTLDEIKSHLKIQAVNDVKRITFTRNDETISTDTS